ncbi:Uncharacterized protein At4g02000 [Linum perenne]
MEEDLEALRLEDDEEIELEIPELEESESDEVYTLCATGTLLTDRSFNFEMMKHRLAEIWRPVKGMSVRDLGNKLILFRFYHVLDLRWVIDNGPWTHNGYLLVLHEMRDGDKPLEVSLTTADFWIQLYGLPRSYYIEPVGKAMGNFIGSYISWDEKLHGGVGEEFMRVRVKMDVRKSLKREKKVKKPGGAAAVCRFRYEKLPTFCFICGLIGHVERNCQIRFQHYEQDITRLWGPELRAPPRINKPRGGERWLVEETEIKCQLGSEYG